MRSVVHATVAAITLAMLGCRTEEPAPRHPRLADFDGVPEWTAEDELISSTISFRSIAPDEFVISPATAGGELLAEVLRGEVSPDLAVQAIREIAIREAREEFDRAPTLARVGQGVADEVDGPDVKPALSGVPLLISQGVDPVDAVVRYNKGQVRYCHEIANLKAGAEITGRVEYLWDIESGRAVDIRMLDNTTTDDDLARCIRAKIQKWSFPEDREAVSYPFVFRG